MRAALKKDYLSEATINHFEVTLKMLNESLGMCLPTKLVMLEVDPDATARLGEARSEHLAFVE